MLSKRATRTSRSIVIVRYLGRDAGRHGPRLGLVLAEWAWELDCRWHGPPDTSDPGLPHSQRRPSRESRGCSSRIPLLRHTVRGTLPQGGLMAEQSHAGGDEDIGSSSQDAPTCISLWQVNEPRPE